MYDARSSVDPRVLAESCSCASRTLGGSGRRVRQWEGGTGSMPVGILTQEGGRGGDAMLLPWTCARNFTGTDPRNPARNPAASEMALGTVLAHQSACSEAI